MNGEIGERKRKREERWKPEPKDHARSCGYELGWHGGVT